MGKTKSSVAGLRALQLAQLHAEKCELKESHAAYTLALREARREGDARAVMEALSGLLRLASEALDELELQRIDVELNQQMTRDPKHIPPMAWYCKGAVARLRNEHERAQRHFHQYLRAVRKSPQATWSGFPTTREELEDRGWAILAVTQLERGKLKRAAWLAELILARVKKTKTRGVEGTLYLLKGNLAEKRKKPEEAMAEYQRAHSAFLSEHNWYYHLYVLYAYARVQRLKQNYTQATWFLDLVERACTGPEFGALLREIATERRRLEEDAVDILIDSRRGAVRTRESGTVSLRKQYVLLHILEALGTDPTKGLSKADLIERVWRERYRPEAHDNKLYYTINRLRKLIAPDVRKPQYLLNWKEGYRLAPGLRIQLVRDTAAHGEGRQQV